jgi:hypothetical protein
VFLILSFLKSRAERRQKSISVEFNFAVLYFIVTIIYNSSFQNRNIPHAGCFRLQGTLIRTHLAAQQYDSEENNSLHSHLSKKIGLTKVVLWATRDETSTLIRIVSYRVRPVEWNCSFKNTACADKGNVYLFCLWHILNVYLFIAVCVSYFLAATKFATFQRLIKYWLHFCK